MFQNLCFCVLRTFSLYVHDELYAEGHPIFKMRAGTEVQSKVACPPAHDGKGLGLQDPALSHSEQA